MKKTVCTTVGLLGLAVVTVAPVAADQVILDDLIVDGSICAGLDCVNGESFGFDTIRLKENNLRIKFQDTSASASFPSNDWQITANDSSNGGLNKFSIDDIDGGRTPFTIEAGAPSHSLYVEDGGKLGLGTSTPVVDVHIVSGNTPTLRLEQDGSSGFTPQTWDVAGNETNFFIRDATNGSTLPLRIFPGADSDSLNIDADGDVGLGDTSPDADFEVQRSGGTDMMATALGGDARLLLNASGGQAARLIFSADDGDDVWNNAVNQNGNLIFNGAGAGNEFLLTSAGNLTLAGSINTSDCSPCVSDYVFEEDWQRMPLEELEEYVWREKHLPNVPSQKDVDKAGKLNMTEMQMRILEKVEELVLYTIDQQKLIDGLEGRNSELVERLAAMEASLAELGQ